jgi:Pyridoxamine 5'-phosphate oxidase
VDARTRRAALRARRNPGRPAGSRRTSPRQALTPGQREQFERVRGIVKRLVDVTPLVGVAVDGAVHFVTGLGEQKARNLEHNRDVALTTGANAWRKGMDVVVEGTAERVTEREALQRVADAYDAKYGGDWRFEVGDGVFHHGEATDGAVFRIAPAKILALAKEPHGQTMFLFG